MCETDDIRITGIHVFIYFTNNVMTQQLLLATVMQSHSLNQQPHVWRPFACQDVRHSAMYSLPQIVIVYTTGRFLSIIAEMVRYKCKCSITLRYPKEYAQSYIISVSKCGRFEMVYDIPKAIPVFIQPVFISKIHEP